MAELDRARELVARLIAGLFGGVRGDEARAVVDDLSARWRGDAVRLGEGTRAKAAGLAHELGLVTRDDLDELELRVAQLEHRLRLVEGGESS